MLEIKLRHRRGFNPHKRFSGLAIAGIAVGVAGVAYSAYSQKKAADKAAQIDTSTAELNSRFDILQAEQLDADTKQNIRTMRQEGKVYLSKQEASYASAGVLSNTGSALAAQITNVGRLEQQVQQEYLNSQQRQQTLYAQAKAGIAAGDARASADRAAGTLALINGGVQLSRMAFSAYQSGVFSSKSVNPYSQAAVI